ncbi:hypothetical protein [Vibrio phage JSF14]|nr:hypothetical protein [Vibrio phage JSF14]
MDTEKGETYMNNINAALMKDTYKAFHKFSHNPEVTHV